MFSSLDLHHYLDALVFGTKTAWVVRVFRWVHVEAAGGFGGSRDWELRLAGCRLLRWEPRLGVAGAATGSCGLPDAMVGDAAVSPGLTRSAGVAGSAEDCEGCGVRV